MVRPSSAARPRTPAPSPARCRPAAPRRARRGRGARGARGRRRHARPRPCRRGEIGEERRRRAGQHGVALALRRHEAPLVGVAGAGAAPGSRLADLFPGRGPPRRRTRSRFSRSSIAVGDGVERHRLRASAPWSRGSATAGSRRSRGPRNGARSPRSRARRLFGLHAARSRSAERRAGPAAGASAFQSVSPWRMK